MTSSLKALRATVEGSRTPGGRLRAAARVEVAAEIERVRAEGATYSAIAAALGVSMQTLKRWRSSEGSSALAIVRVVDAAPGARALTMYGPRGVRVEDLSLDEVAALLVRLSS